MTTERARLFVALELSENVRSELAGWRSALLAQTPALRAVPPDSLHVTLCFLGATAVDAIAEIGEACLAAVERVQRDPIPLALAGSLWLPPRRPRVLTVVITDRAGRLAALQHELSGALSGGGWYRPEQRPFLAHVTVARVRSSERIRPLELDPPSAIAFAGSTVTLYRSWPGSRYEPLRTAAISV